LNITDFEGRFDEIKAANITATYTLFLRDLRLTCWDHDHKFWHEVIPFLAGFRTPRLQSLVLTHFAWHALSPNERSAFLRRFQSIVSLQLSLYKQDTPRDVAIVICSFPQLQELDLLPGSYTCIIWAIGIVT
jgi:hypothetical protein